MPAHSKVQDMKEVLRWIDEGRTYKWMCDEYLRKYNLEVSISMFAGIRRRQGLDQRIVRDTELFPWKVKEEHRYAHAAGMLRAEGRRRAGKALTPLAQQTLEGWLRGLERDGVVVHYDPDTEQGWWYVERRPGIDTDIIRVPDRKTGRRSEE